MMKSIWYCSIFEVDSVLKKFRDILESITFYTEIMWKNNKSVCFSYILCLDIYIQGVLLPGKTWKVFFKFFKLSSHLQ